MPNIELKTLYVAFGDDVEAVELISPKRQCKLLNISPSTLRVRRSRDQLNDDDYVYVEAGYYQFANTFDESEAYEPDT